MKDVYFDIIFYNETYIFHLLTVKVVEIMSFGQNNAAKYAYEADFYLRGLIGVLRVDQPFGGEINPRPGVDF